MLGNVKISKSSWVRILQVQIELSSFHEMHLLPRKHNSPAKGQVPANGTQATVSNWKQQCSIKGVVQPTQDFPVCLSYDNADSPVLEAWEKGRTV